MDQERKRKAHWACQGSVAVYGPSIAYSHQITWAQMQRARFATPPTDDLVYPPSAADRRPPGKEPAPIGSARLGSPPPSSPRTRRDLDPDPANCTRRHSPPSPGRHCSGVGDHPPGIGPIASFLGKEALACLDQSVVLFLRIFLCREHSNPKFSSLGWAAEPFTHFVVDFSASIGGKCVWLF